MRACSLFFTGIWRGRTSRCRAAAGIVAAAAVLSAWACSSPTDPYGAGGTAGEAIAFEHVGAATILFRRTWPELDQFGSPVITTIALHGDSRSAAQVLTAGGLAALSRDGTQLALVNLVWDEHGLGYRASVREMIGGATRAIGYVPGMIVGKPAWSPDGKFVYIASATIGQSSIQRLAYNATIADQAHTLLILDGLFRTPRCADAGAHVSVTSTERIAITCDTGAVIRALGAGASDGPTYVARSATAGDRRVRLYSPVWSADGERIAFVEQEERSEDPFISWMAVRVLHVAEGSIETVFEQHLDLAVMVEQLARSLCWLGGDQKLAFTKPGAGASAGETASHIYVVGLGGGVPHQLTTRPGVTDTNLSCAG